MLDDVEKTRRTRVVRPALILTKDECKLIDRALGLVYDQCFTSGQNSSDTRDSVMEVVVLTDKLRKFAVRAVDSASAEEEE